MITKDQIPEVIGHTAYDRSHQKLGKIGDVYLDRETGTPEWFTVRTGLFGTNESFVPLQSAELRGEEIVVPFPQEQIKEAPQISTDDGNLPPGEEARLYQHYGLPYEQAPETTVDAAEPTPGSPAATGAPVAGAPRGVVPEGDHTGEGRPEARAERRGDDAMTRSEEHLRIGTERRETGRARLHKYVETEYEEHTVPVRRERVRVEHEPITDQNREQAMAGPDITEAEHEVVLREEHPVVEKETRPVERVRMEKDAIEEDETVGDEVRRERIEAEGVDEFDIGRRASRNGQRPER